MSLNGSKEPIGPAKPEPGPALPSVVAAAANESNTLTSMPCRVESSNTTTSPPSRTPR